MTQARFRRSQISTIGLILSQAFGLNLLGLNAFAQNPNGAARPALPIPMSTSTLIGLEQPPQFVVPSKAALPTAPAPSNVTGNSAGNTQGQLVDLIVRECANAVRDGTWEGDNFAARVEGVFGINHPTITFRDEE